MRAHDRTLELGSCAAVSVDETIRTDIKERIRRTADFIARSAGASAEVVRLAAQPK